jgi:formylglycine-generating enzyme required for sulfatase activity/DNA-binding winged helix-turn-helix (wHTH) protein
MAYRIGEYVIDPAAYELRRGDALLPVEPQVLELLVFLIENRQRAVTKDEIIERIWNGRIVSDATLSSRIKAARQALGDDGAAQKLIRTIHGRGFRFVGELAEADLPADAQPKQPAPAAGEGEALAQHRQQRRHWVQALTVYIQGGVLAARLHGLPRWAAAAAAFVVILGTGYVLGSLLIRPAAQTGTSALKASIPGHKAFDGRWRVENAGNEHCFHKRSVMFWTIADGTLHQDGTGTGTVSVTGELSFRRAGAEDPSRIVVYSGGLERDEGSGSYFLERSKCAGTIRLTRLAPPSNAAAAPKTGESQPRPTFRDCDLCPEMAVLPEGFFLMGSPPDEEGRSLAEGPQRVVRFATPFAIGRFEVTIDEFAAFVDETGYQAATHCLVYAFDVDQLVLRPHTFRNPPYKVSGSHPAACVSWDDAKAYMAWLARKTGKPYRLPSESEWEYAARAGTTIPFSFGMIDPATVCQHAKTSDASTRFPWRHAGCDSGWGHGAAPVGKHRPNAWGLYDMLGNLWEWVEDCWHGSFVDAPVDGSAWTKNGDCAQRVSRGGSWANRPRAVRVAARIAYAASAASSNRGYRVALTLGPQR